MEFSYCNCIMHNDNAIQTSTRKLFHLVTEDDTQKCGTINDHVGRILCVGFWVIQLIRNYYYLLQQRDFTLPFFVWKNKPIIRVPTYWLELRTQIIILKMDFFFIVKPALNPSSHSFNLSFPKKKKSHLKISLEKKIVLHNSDSKDSKYTS